MGALLAKIVFLQMLGLTAVTRTVYFVCLIVLAIFCGRKLGVINYLEAMLVAGVWTFFSLFFEFFIIVSLYGFSLHKRWEFWVGYLAVALSIFIFHKKRHVVIRKELVAHHAHHGHGGH